MEELRTVNKVSKHVDHELEQDAQQLETLNLRLGWVERRRLIQELDAFNLTLPQYMALRCMAHNAEGCSMSELAESSHQLSATMTGIVDRLVDRGLVARERDPFDRRSLRVTLTDEGQRVMKAVSEHKRAALSALLSSVPPEKRRAMVGVFEQYLSLVENAIKTTKP